MFVFLIDVTLESCLLVKKDLILKKHSGLHRTLIISLFYLGKEFLELRNKFGSQQPDQKS
jgi:hypothetical protein